jgi:hypothetical protein
MLERLSSLLGPITFIQDVSWENQVTGIVACAILIPCMAIGVFRPSWWSVLVAILALGAWLFMGIIGMGIDC